MTSLLAFTTIRASSVEEEKYAVKWPEPVYSYKLLSIKNGSPEV